jgi:hypothetical protein
MIVIAGLVPATCVLDIGADTTWMPGNKFTPGPAGGRTRVAGHDVSNTRRG